MTRAEATAELARLSFSLAPDEAGVARLLERISVQAEASLLRDVLVECGALAVLKEATCS